MVQTASKTNKQSRLPHLGGQGVLITLSLLMAFSSISIDLYLPALPTMAIALGAGAGEMTFTIAAYLAGLTIGQLIWGPMGDAVGRKRPIIAGLLVFIASSIGCALSSSALELSAFRLFQGFGASAGVVLARAILRDLYSGDDAARKLSTLIAIMALSPLVGPIIGAKLLETFGWPQIFWILAAVGGIAMCAVLRIPETWRRTVFQPGDPSGIFGRYAAIWRNRELWTYAGAGAFYYFGMFGFIGASAEVFISQQGLSPSAFAWLLAGGTAVIIITNMINTQLLRHFSYQVILRSGAAVSFLSALIGLTLNAYYGEVLSTMIFVIVVFMAMAGFVVSNSIVGSINECPNQAGTASALVGALQYGGGMAGATFVALFADGSARAMFFAMLLGGIGSYLLARNTIARRLGP